VLIDKRVKKKRRDKVTRINVRGVGLERFTERLPHTLLRRLHPNKSEEELLAQIQAEPQSRVASKQKRGWFSKR